MRFMNGLSVKSRLDFVRERFGEEGLTRVLDALDDEDRVQLGGIILASSSYPVGVFERLLVTIDTVLGRADGSLIVETGRYNARVGLSGTYSIYAGKGPRAFCENLPRLYNRFTRFSGECSVELGDDSAVFSLKNVSEIVALSVEGFLEGALELSGASWAKTSREVDGEWTNFTLAWGTG